MLSQQSLEPHARDQDDEGKLRAIRRTLSDSYVHSMLRIAKHFEIQNDLALSEQELKLALEEAEIDVRALFMRRNTGHGISAGKIAGVYAFRLSRFKIVHAVTENALTHPALHLIQDLVALNAVKRRILRVKMGDERMLELAYQMSRRHANQETLGLAFDAILQATGRSPNHWTRSDLSPRRKKAWWGILKFWK